MDSEFLTLDQLPTIARTGEAIQQGRTTCREVLEQCLARIDRWEPRIHAWVSVDREGARGLADERDSERKAGRWRGPLHGMPLGIKDIIDMAGLPTGAGSRRLMETVVANDATVVRRLREAGAILLGKTVTTQFACFDPPPTRNPWHTEHTPGGSSSGSAAGVATGMCLGAIGSQTGGSITRPASYCGVAGAKPTFGRVSLAGVMPLAPSLDHPGPIGRSVGDLVILLEAIAGPDPTDPRTSAPGMQPVDFALAKRPISSPPRLARLRGFFESGALPAMRSVFEDAQSQLAARGAAISEAELPPTFADVHRQHRVILQYELSRAHATRIRAERVDYLPGVAGLIEEGLAIPESAYEEARRHQARAVKEIAGIFGNADVALCPAAPGPAPDLTTTGDPSFNSPWSHTGLPTVTFPMGAVDGMPLGIQLIGRRGDESRLFQVALWCEGVLRPAARG